MISFDQFSGQQRRLFGTFADQLIPSDGAMPLPTEIGVHESGLKRLVQVRPDLAKRLHEVLVEALTSGEPDVLALERSRQADFDTVAAAAAGIYLTDEDIQRRYRYPGHVAADVGDPRLRIAEYEELTSAVRAGGFIWRSTPHADRSRVRSTRRKEEQMATYKTLKVNRGNELQNAPGQTAYARRVSGVSVETSEVERLWYGKVHTGAGATSNAHHHGEAETGGYVLQGTGFIRFGERYEEIVYLEQGDFVYVPPFLPHIEGNASQSQELIWLTTRTPDNIVVNLEDEDIADLILDYR